jgi:HlyD family secretion protein
MKRRLIVAPVVLILAGALLWLAWKPRSDDAAVLSGYVEGESLYLAAPIAGPVTRVAVVRGQRVGSGAELFTLDARQVGAQSDQRRAEIAQSDAQVRAARADLDHALAAAESARALAADARRVAARYEKMKRDDAGTVSTQDLESAQAKAVSTAAQARAADEQAKAQAAQVAASEARVNQGRAALADVGVRAEQLAPRAPGPARVEEVYFQSGEWAAANQPILSLLPDDRIKLRFFVPEREAALYRPGAEVRFGCDSCGAERRARIVYVSPRAEFTPPVIYSRKSRDRLVFMVEARPTDPASLTPGLPVDVTPLGGVPERRR